MTKLILFIVISFKVLFADPLFSIIPKLKIENKDKYNLGKKLFFDQNLSSSKSVACANCHIFELGGADGNRVSYGVYGKAGIINSPSIFNTKFNIAQDWVGECTTVKDRSKMAFLSKIEMAGDVKETLKYIKSNKSLNNLFQKVYNDFNGDNIFDAIAYYVEHLTTPNSRFDKFLQGDTKALNENEKKGYRLFKDYGCVSCHNGVNIGGNLYQKFGIFNKDEIKRDDNLGRYQITKKEYDKYVLKVPSLRNVSKTAPYMYNGRITKLKDVIKEMGEHQLGIDIPLKDILSIESFLKTLDGDIPND